MNKKHQKYSHSKGQAPGTLIYTGKKPDNDLSIDVFKYTTTYVAEKVFTDHEKLFAFIDTAHTTWININGLNHVDEIKAICNGFNLPPLLQEDIVNVQQRPKTDEYQNSLFVSLKMLYFNKRKKIVNEQISIILHKNNVITFQEAEGDVFDDLRERIKEKKGRIRNANADYLFYALIDSVIDYYYEIIESIETKIEILEAQLFKETTTSTNITTQIQTLKQDVLKVRRAIFPLREVINRISKNDSSLVSISTLEYFKDAQDHLVQITENIDLYREMIWSLMDLHISTISNKTNDVMKVLTIVSTIFIPLTFIAGLYGMNFKNMPELDTQSGYFVVLFIMVLVVVSMAYYFKQKKWL